MKFEKGCIKKLNNPRNCIAYYNIKTDEVWVNEYPSMSGYTLYDDDNIVMVNLEMCEYGDYGSKKWTRLILEEAVNNTMAWLKHANLI